MTLRIALTSVMVGDQERALAFYRDVLGFALKRDLPMGGPRWLTDVAPAAPDGVELLLEPIGFEPARAYQQALFSAGIPATAFAVEDIAAEHRRLVAKGVAFRSGPTSAGPGPATAVFEDGCGNLIQIFETAMEAQTA
ncbi:MAG: VOC family protein [Candidatus Kaistia colombiensis]|nr:MAG: VOC family protein [Kaistia sp.]